VSGSRSWAEEMCPVIHRELSKLPRGSWVIHGGQRRRIPETIVKNAAGKIVACEYSGVDYWVDKVAQDLGLLRVVLPFVPGTGKAGGPIRNSAMCDIAKGLEMTGHEVSALFFHDDIERSLGTKDCRDKAERAGLKYDTVRG